MIFKLTKIADMLLMLLLEDNLYSLLDAIAHHLLANINKNAQVIYYSLIYN